MADTNMIPSINAAGRFEAIAPFDQVVNPAKYYVVEALETIGKMESLKANLYELMFAPIGVPENQYNTVLSRARSMGAVVVTLMDRDRVPTYVFSTYFKSFPVTDGVLYENMVLTASLGPCHPGMAVELTDTMEHVKQTILDRHGIDTVVRLGTIPQIAYTSRLQHEAFENTRKAKITSNQSDVARVRELEQLLLARDAYIQQLEANQVKP